MEVGWAIRKICPAHQFRLILLNNLVNDPTLHAMPDYRITIHMKIGRLREGVRWHPSYDADYVHSLIEKKIRKTIGMSAVKWIEVDIIARSKGDRMDSKNLDAD